MRVFFTSTCWSKNPAPRKRTPWHHDQPYYGIDGTKSCSLWIPLDSVPEDTCPVEFVAGSHRWGPQCSYRACSAAKTTSAPTTTTKPIPDFDAHRADYDIRTWSVEPGDAIAFHFLTVHGAPPNLSATRRRRAFSARWVGDDATYAVRAGATSPPFPGARRAPRPWRSPGRARVSGDLAKRS